MYIKNPRTQISIPFILNLKLDSETKKLKKIAVTKTEVHKANQISLGVSTESTNSLDQTKGVASMSTKNTYAAPDKKRLENFGFNKKRFDLYYSIKIER